MQEDVIKLSPDALGYKDRGKMKWMGMMLSDHAEALKKQKKSQPVSRDRSKRETDTRRHQRLSL
ncbi:MAG: hypothetical protein LRY37_06590 [Alkalibacterium thalassium]|nr:hypothetical protein [Alkalibacterium thalassium]